MESATNPIVLENDEIVEDEEVREGAEVVLPREETESESVDGDDGSDESY